jgi:XRE family transcriptional regulator of biofilm formation
MNGIIVGQRVKLLRLGRGWSMGKLADKSGLTVGYISKLEGGKYKLPRAETLQKLCSALGIPLESLVSDQAQIEELEAQRTEIDIMARKVAVILPDLQLDDPVLFLERISKLSTDRQQVLEELAEFLEIRQKRGAPETFAHEGVSGKVLGKARRKHKGVDANELRRAAEDNQHYDVDGGGGPYDSFAQAK